MEVAVNKTYKALAWLAGLSLVFGVAFAIRWTAQTIGYYEQVPRLSTDDGLFTGLVTGIGLDPMSSFKALTFLLVGGATLLAIALAWADRRYGWLIALIVVTILALLWPWGIDAWGFVNSPPILLTATPSSVSASFKVAAFSVYAAPLVAVVLALILALTRGRSAPGSAPALAQNSQ